MEKEVFLIGAWSNFDSLEDSLTLEELYILANTQQLKEHRLIRKLGAIQGVDIPDIDDASSSSEDEESFRDRVERRMRTENRGGQSIPEGMMGTGYQQV